MLNATDRTILHELTHDGRLSNVELAERVALTLMPCLRRIKCLEDKSLIFGYCARLGPEAAGRAFSAYTAAEITMTSREIVEQFEAALIPNEEVIEARRVYGAIDCLVRIDVEDSNAYKLPNQRSTRCQVYARRLPHHHEAH